MDFFNNINGIDTLELPSLKVLREIKVDEELSKLKKLGMSKLGITEDPMI